MKKEIIFCDDCGAEIKSLYNSIKIIINDTEYHFCYPCCGANFLMNESRKVRKYNRPDVEFGGELNG